MIRMEIQVAGVVQGVGSRPALANAAAKAGLRGWVRNDHGVVHLCLVGRAAAVHALADRLVGVMPGDALVTCVRVLAYRRFVEEVPDGFEIVQGTGRKAGVSGLVADRAPCAACTREVLQPGSRYFGYAFTSCTDCGPRFSLVHDLPWERHNTGMDRFPMCAACRHEYTDVYDRRFHAQTIACPACGPVLTYDTKTSTYPSDQALSVAADALQSGRVIALRGVGGYQLACDARNPEAIQRLRQVRNRPDKPLALMVADLAVVGAIAAPSAQEKELLASPAAPIVVLARRLPDPDWCAQVAPDTDTVGIMLPSSPLHQLLLQQKTCPRFLVMTSGNAPGEPICLDPDTAETRLGHMVDGMLHHNRPVAQRLDDSLLRVFSDGVQIVRRARGFTPGTIDVGKRLAGTVLALGADRKNTLALGLGQSAMLSQHIGNLVSQATCDFHIETAARMLALSGVQAHTIAVDQHPDMFSSRTGRGMAQEQGHALVEVQHHHAHAAAVMAEHRLEESLALVLDGTGYGPDGTIWGAELLHVRDGSFEQIGSFCPVPLPGGDAAVLHPARQLLARWIAAGITMQDIHPAWWGHLGIAQNEAEIWQAQIQADLHCPRSRAAGRVFDAFACLAGVAPPKVTWEGQPAIRLETLAGRVASQDVAGVEVQEKDGMILVDWQGVFSAFAPAAPPVDTAGLAASLHQTMHTVCMQMVDYGHDRTGTVSVVLAGGVMMNTRLRTSLCSAMTQKGFRVHTPHEVPCGDGGIALGQLAVAGGIV